MRAYTTAAEEEWSHLEFLRRLVQEELIAREEKQLEKRNRLARFLYEKSLEQFQFRFRPELKKAVFQDYTEDSFVHHGKRLIFIGPAGTGKTHLSIGIGLKLICRGFNVRFITVQGLINQALKLEHVQRQ